MANTKISALTNGNPALTGDLIPIDRTGANFSVTAGSIAALAPAPTPPAFSAITAGTNAAALVVGTGGSLGVSGTGTIAATSAPWSTLTGTLSNSQVIPYGDAGISRLGAASLAIGNGTAGNFSGALYCSVLIDPQTVSYIAALVDADQLVTITDASASTFTIPTNASVAFPVGTVLSVSQLGTGQITLTPASGAVTIHTPSSLTTRAQYSTVAVLQTAANVWLAMGDLT